MIEALKKAREALATCNSNDGDDPWYDADKVREAIAAIDAALAQADAPQPSHALENCRLYAARHRREEWAKTILRFCAEGGSTGSPLRAQADALADEPTMDDVLDALNVFNPPSARDGDPSPWDETNFIAVTALPAFIHNVGRAWYGQARAASAPAAPKEPT